MNNIKDIKFSKVVSIVAFIVLSSIIGILSTKEVINYSLVIACIFIGIYCFISKKYKNKPIELYIMTFFMLKPQINAILISIFFIVYIIKNKLKTPNIVVLLLLFVLTNLTSITDAMIKARVYTEIIAWSINILIFIIAYSMINNYNYKKIYKIIIINGILANSVLILKVKNIELYNLISSIPIVHIPDTNYLAMYVALILPITLYMGEQNENDSLSRLKYIVIGLFYILGLITIDSRGTIALSILVLTIYLIRISTNKKHVLMLVVSTIIIVISKLQLKVVFEELFSTNNYSNYVRYKIVDDTIMKMIPENLVNGVGAGNFSYAYGKYASINFNPSHAHNILLNITAELGIVGLVLILLIIGIFIKKIIVSLVKKSNIRLNEHTKIFNMYLYINLEFLLYSMVENTWGDSRVSILYFILMGNMCKLYEYCKNEEINKNECING